MSKLPEMTNPEVKISVIFKTFLKMGTFAFGGVYSMLSFFERELVDRKKWLSHDDFTESVAMGQITPGAPVVNTGLFIGHKLAGFKGSLATIFGQVLPSFLVIIGLAAIYLEYKELAIIRSVLKGIAAAVTGLIFSVVINMGKKMKIDKPGQFIFFISLLAVLVFRASPLLIIVFSGISGYFTYRNVK